MPTDPKTLIVSLHDVHPDSLAQIGEQIAFLAGYGIARTSLLVVPNFHHQRLGDLQKAIPGDRHGLAGAGARDRPARLFSRPAGIAAHDAGHVFLDASLHQSRGGVPGPAARFGAHAVAARARSLRLLRLAAGRLRCAGVADGRGSAALLAELGFAYTTRLREIVPLRRGADGGATVASQSLCYSARAAWRRFASAAWNKRLFERLRDGDLIRLSLHPHDLEFPLLRRQIDQILRAALKRGFEPTTYGDYVAR
ncbi:MAG: hypothetical protein WDO13_18590 [Verrucomicrobiota bacterium]